MNEMALTESRLPQYADGYIYILEISSGRVKVGFTTNLKTRLATHAGTAKAYGATITRTWTSPLHKEARPNEKKLITFCRSVENAEQEGEYFAGVAFDAVTAFAESELPITPVAPDSTERERQKARDRRERALILDRFEERTEFAPPCTRSDHSRRSYRRAHPGFRVAHESEGHASSKAPGSCRAGRSTGDPRGVRGRRRVVTGLELLAAAPSTVGRLRVRDPRATTA